MTREVSHVCDLASMRECTQPAEHILRGPGGLTMHPPKDPLGVV